MFKNTCRLFSNLNPDKSETFQQVYFHLVDLVFELFTLTGDPLSMIFFSNEKKHNICQITENRNKIGRSCSRARNI